MADGKWTRTEKGNWVWTGDEPPPVPDRDWWVRVVVLIGTAVALISLIPTTVAIVAWRQVSTHRIEDNRAAIVREKKLRLETTRALKTLASEQCVKIENTQAVIVNLLLYSQRNTPSRVVQRAIDALEPSNEKDCPLPPGREP